MTVACDFCSKRADRHEETIFIAAASRLAHICEECVDISREVISARRRENRIESLCGPDYGQGTAHRANPQQKGTHMTNTPKDTENHGNATTVHNPKAPGQVEKVNPTTGDTTTESTNVQKPKDR